MPRSPAPALTAPLRVTHTCVAEVGLPLHVVVVAVDGLALHLEGRELLAHHPHHRRHHHLAVVAGELLRPGDGRDVVLKQRLALLQPGKVSVGQRPGELPPVQGLARLGDEIGADAVADAARARMQHGPDALLLVEADLDEVVAAAERAQMRDALRLGDAWMRLFQLFQAVGEAAVGEAARNRVGHALLPAALEADAAVGHRGLDAAAQLGEVVGQVACRERGAHRHHAAADVHAHRRRHDGGPGGDDRADGGALAQVHVRHHRHVVVNEGERGDVEELAARGVLHRHAGDPRLDRRVARLDDLRSGHGRSHCAMSP